MTVCGALLALMSSSVLATSRESCDMPMGVTLRTIKVGPQLTERLVLASPTGLPLYTFQNDTKPGKSACTGECATAWPPLVAPRNARKTTDWSVVKRNDGTQQWAFRGKPLYTFVKDTAPYAPLQDAIKPPPAVPAVAVTPKDAAAAGAPKTEAPAVAAPPKGDALGEGIGGVWSIAAVEPAKWTKLVAGISVAEVIAASGQVLVSTKGTPLYVFSGGDAGSLSDQWTPVIAAEIDLPVGEFSIASRADGTPQWAFRKMPLYTFNGDVEVGDVNGDGLVPGMNPAVILSYFRPSQIAVRRDERRGGVLVEASSGKTLYARDRAVWNARAAHYARGETRGAPEVGTSIGLTGCDVACEKTWPPLLAARDAQVSGYWSVLGRDDGTQQWAYRGFPLYTRAGEPPGQVLHHDTYDLAINHQTAAVAPANRGWALYWRAAVP